MPARLDTATVFESSFDIYRRQATLLLPAALLVFVPVACLTVLAAVTGSVALLILAVVAGVVAQFWFQGMVVEAVRDILDGRRDYSLDELLRSVTPVAGALIWAGILAGLGIAVGFLLLILPGLILLTLWALLAPVIVLERLRGSAAFGRSVQLVRGNGFRVFGVIVVLFIIQALVAQILQTVGESAAGDAGVGVGQLVGNVLLAPLAAIAATVMYLQLSGVAADAAAIAGGGAGAPVSGGWDGPLSGGRDEPISGGWAPPGGAPARSEAPDAGSSGWAPPVAPPAQESFGAGAPTPREPAGGSAARPEEPAARPATDRTTEPPQGHRGPQES